MKVQHGNLLPKMNLDHSALLYKSNQFVDKAGFEVKSETVSWVFNMIVLGRLSLDESTLGYEAIRVKKKRFFLLKYTERISL